MDKPDRLLPFLLALLALVGLFNLLMGAYLYTAYQNHKYDAASTEEIQKTHPDGMRFLRDVRDDGGTPLAKRRKMP